MASNSTEAKQGGRLDPRRNPHFCVVPWTHTYLSPQSERRLCCASREQSSFVQQYIDQPGAHGEAYRPASLDEHWNGEHMRDVRRRMLAGERLPECEVCDNQTLSLSTYRHWFTRELFPELLAKVEESTAEDGSTTLEPISFDYRFSNACNFKCRTCGDQFSSSWERESRDGGDYERRRDPWLEPANRQAIRDFQATTVEDEFARAVREKRVRELYWVGGEPLAWPQHWKYMKEIVELGYAGEVYARYNTNLSLIDSGGTRLMHDLLRHFKGYMISASIDGAGRIGEFIRTGLEWKRWLANFEVCLESARAQGRGDTAVMFDVTLSLPSLFCIRELFEEALRLDVRMETKIMYAFDPFVILHPLAPPKAATLPLLDRLISEIEPRAGEKQMPLVRTLRELRERPSFEELYPRTWREGFKSGRDYLRRIAERRGDGRDGRTSFEEIYAAEPAIRKWWGQEI